jgi:methyl-CpG-binding domain protein 4
MWKFFMRYPTANQAASVDPREIQEMIQPLGLSERRSIALVRMSKDYLLKEWKDAPEVLYGIGKYASDAYRIFCLGQWQSVEPKDGALVNYHNFLRKTISDPQACTA